MKYTREGSFLACCSRVLSLSLFLPNVVPSVSNPSSFLVSVESFFSGCSLSLAGKTKPGKSHIKLACEQQTFLLAHRR